MLLNTYKDLIQDFITKLNEAKNTLCYTLLLPISAEDFIKKEKCTNKHFTLIDAISKFTYSTFPPIKLV